MGCVSQQSPEVRFSMHLRRNAAVPALRCQAMSARPLVFVCSPLYMYKLKMVGWLKRNMSSQRKFHFFFWMSLKCGFQRCLFVELNARTFFSWWQKYILTLEVYSQKSPKQFAETISASCFKKSQKPKPIIPQGFSLFQAEVTPATFLRLSVIGILILRPLINIARNLIKPNL